MAVVIPDATNRGTAPPPVTGQVPAALRARNDRWANRDWLPAVGFLTPNLVLFTVFIIIPVLLAIGLSFTSWNLVGSPHWAGLQNYRQLLNDPAVPQAIGTTMQFLVVGVVPTVVIGLVLAMLVNTQFPLVAAVRTLYFVPAVVSFAASAVLWQWLYRPGQGILDYLLHQVGIIGPAWLSNTHTALFALDIVAIWLSLPTTVLLYLAALQRIPAQTIEAATLDGAGAFRRLRYIIWPGVRNMTILVVIISVLAFTNGSFDLVNIMTQGGPINATTTLIYYIYYTAFNNIQLGYAAALSVLQLLLFGALLALLALVRRLTT
ncbi:MAG TPA: sugar ABC transporter permease [Acidimicrobiales bacterium]|nr:sugar ABC transporter permease [Acidimicrobiales bacterium]